MKALILCMALTLLFSAACNKSDIGEGATLPSPPTSGQLSSDKARYDPGEPVQLTFAGDITPEMKVRYRQLNTVLDEASLTSTQWTWTPPAGDFKGYLAEVVSTTDNHEVTVATIGIDVSSSWKKFPRYGFLSKFPQLTDEAMETVIANLTRHHINGIQFYDWQYKHHRPLAGTATSPDDSWKDIINRENFRSTVEGYIAKAHARNMMAMFYDLAYGALSSAEADGVSKEWYMYTDAAHSDIDKFVLPKPPFVSDIRFVDPSNTAWQYYINQETAKVYQAYAFDGYHIDQVGNRDKTLYRFSGGVIDLPNTFRPFIEAAKESAPGKALVMNAVNQYGQEGIARAPVDFLYSEVWQPNETYNALAQIIKDNNRLSMDEKSTVLAAYVNYNMAEKPGYFNTPSVLMLDAVIFAFGGAHLELGEHMLGKEYFPNSNLEMKEDLRKSLAPYYDFLVAYQNLLRDGGTFNTVTMTSTDGKVSFQPWPMQRGSVATVGKEFADRQVIHLINFTEAGTDQWRDNAGIQADPGLTEQLPVRVTATRPVKSIWFASPDIYGGAPQTLSFASSGDQVSFVLPGLKYWDMVVVEF